MAIMQHARIYAAVIAHRLSSSVDEEEKMEAMNLSLKLLGLDLLHRTDLDDFSKNSFL